MAKRSSISTLLSVACGTGKREAAIRDILGHALEIVGVDVSQKMCDLATLEGISAVCSPWLDTELGIREFDAAIYLHSFGLTPTREERIAELQKIAKFLRTGAPFYIDVFNVSDRQEWGPKILEQFQMNSLASCGYEPGDVFYRKIGGKTVSYFHYFSENEIAELLVHAGFHVKDTRYIGYGSRFGEAVSKDEGAIFVIAEKRELK